jgi:hypothetical protein
MSGNRYHSKATKLPDVARLFLPSFGLVLSIAACSDPAAERGSPTAKTESAPSASSTASAAPASSPTPGTSSSAAPGPPEASKRYRGSFKAKKRKIAPQSTAEDDAWKRDDGKAASGPGEIDLTVTGTDVTGTVTGPWGKLSVNGQLSSEGLAATVTPSRDPASTPGHSFEGVLTGKPAGDGLDIEMRVSSGDALLAREGSGHVAPAP